MQRRAFIALFASAAVARPLTASAQQPNRMRRVAVLMLYDENDPQGQLRATVFRQGLEKLRWVVDQNLQIAFYWGVGDLDWMKAAARQILSQNPDVILANGDPAARALQSASSSVPIVFLASDPVTQGFVNSVAHPGGNMTGFTVLEPTVGPKWIELLKAIAPQVTRVAVFFNPDNGGSVIMSHAAVAASPNFGVEAVGSPIREAADVSAVMTTLGREPGGGLVVPADPSVVGHRKLIIELAARYRLPAIYAVRSFTAEGGLISYGVNIPDLFLQAAGYVDRILRGEHAADLPVQSPTRFELIINLKTAKMLALNVPQGLLVAADDVIE